MGRPLIPDGKISRAVREGLILRKKLLDGGMDQAEADRIVGQGLKGAWQSGNERTEPWHSLCRTCNDSGWIIVEPSYVEKQRLTRMYGDPSKCQSYMRACDPCPWREQEREKRQQREGHDEGFAAAGRAPERRRFQR